MRRARTRTRTRTSVAHGVEATVGDDGLHLFRIYHFVVVSLVSPSFFSSSSTCPPPLSIFFKVNNKLHGHVERLSFSWGIHTISTLSKRTGPQPSSPTWRSLSGLAHAIASRQQSCSHSRSVYRKDSPRPCRVLYSTRTGQSAPPLLPAIWVLVARESVKRGRGRRPAYESLWTLLNLMARRSGAYHGQQT
ncbi:hypothetical protein CC80DRAFT_164130 [Byssothecium circinans]|uniref:Uncharacterized protein n=1 Tax=Byssothecium circinans TaxID=147558 RepID=A0A6A5TLB3_9PLEO|nr:hypothetical protein CC80DRAFT_164130 [Byssothecium circinans]